MTRMRPEETTIRNAQKPIRESIDSIVVRAEQKQTVRSRASKGYKASDGAARAQSTSGLNTLMVEDCATQAASFLCIFCTAWILSGASTLFALASLPTFIRIYHSSLAAVFVLLALATAIHILNILLFGIAKHPSEDQGRNSESRRWDQYAIRLARKHPWFVGYLSRLIDIGIRSPIWVPAAAAGFAGITTLELVGAAPQHIGIILGSSTALLGVLLPPFFALLNTYRHETPSCSSTRFVSIWTRITLLVFAYVGVVFFVAQPLKISRVIFVLHDLTYRQDTNPRFHVWLEQLTQYYPLVEFEVAKARQRPADREVAAMPPRSFIVEVYLVDTLAGTGYGGKSSTGRYLFVMNPRVANSYTLAHELTHLFLGHLDMNPGYPFDGQRSNLLTPIITHLQNTVLDSIADLRLSLMTNGLATTLP